VEEEVGVQLEQQCLRHLILLEAVVQAKVAKEVLTELQIEAAVEEAVDKL
jgi:hypothetical protein